jgi:hypothetical protein
MYIIDQREKEKEKERERVYIQRILFLEIRKILKLISFDHSV